MQSYIKNIEIRWSDLDPNFHVLHSKYYDFGAYSRMSFFVDQGLTPKKMSEYSIGPILFREECIFKKEISFGDFITVNLLLTKYTDDYGRWSMQHEIFKNADTLAAVINIDCAWMDTNKRKLTLPPESLHHIFNDTPRSINFEVHKNK